MAGNYPDFMIDVETTGTNSENTMILQLSGVKFNIHDKTISPRFFNRCLLPVPKRFWDESTRDWWRSKPDLLHRIGAAAEPVEPVLRAFQDWACEDIQFEERRFWAKPTTFDWNFVASYFAQFEIMMPFHYRNAMDLNTYIRGRGHWDTKKFWASIPNNGEAHNAIDDCLWQVQGALTA